jgi:hypothetical protein
MRIIGRRNFVMQPSLDPEIFLSERPQPFFHDIEFAREVARGDFGTHEIGQIARQCDGQWGGF